MQKFLKLSTVSMLAIVAATNAHAAGYTCEELIEYTSCNDGYYLNAGKCILGTTCGAGNYLSACGDYAGDRYYTGFCSAYDGGVMTVEDLENYTGFTYEECAALAEANEFEEFEYLDAVCFTDITFDPVYGLLFMHMEPYESITCKPCPAGMYQPIAGQYWCLECPAGSECATDGLATHTLCEIGEYSNTGATTCSSCPATGLTDKSGAVVKATTAQKGSTTSAACYVGEEYSFTDTKGIYHFKSDCALKPWTVYPTTEEECVSFGYQWHCDAECSCMYYGEGIFTHPNAPITEEECVKIENAVWNAELIPNRCECANGWSLGSSGLYCPTNG